MGSFVEALWITFECQASFITLPATDHDIDEITVELIYIRSCFSFYSSQVKK